MEVLAMANAEETMNAAPELSLADRNGRLETLVGELLATNQQLRFRVERLEAEKDGAERALARAAACTALMLT